MFWHIKGEEREIHTFYVAQPRFKAAPFHPLHFIKARSLFFFSIFFFFFANMALISFCADSAGDIFLLLWGRTPTTTSYFNKVGGYCRQIGREEMLFCRQRKRKGVKLFTQNVPD